MAEVTEKSFTSQERGRDIARRVVRHENFVLLVVLLGLIGIFSAITHGATTVRENMSNVLVQSCFRGTTAIGQAFVILTAGIDISVAGVGVLSSIVGGVLMTVGPLNVLGYPMSPFAAVPIMLLIAVAWGAVNGVIITRTGIPPLIATFCIWHISQGIAYYPTGGKTVTDLPESFLGIAGKYIAGVPTGGSVCIVTAVVAYFVLNYTPFGRSVYAVGGNPVSAFLSGVNVRRTQTLVYIISGLTAGMTGVLITSRSLAGSIEGLNGLEFDAIASVIIGGVSLFGGRGNIIGVVLGALIIGVINNAVSVMHAGHAAFYIVKGAIIVAAVALDVLRRR
jgi:ribose/xylose/arabinose/galactoside ABC-type transport system permease subunit